MQTSRMRQIIAKAISEDKQSRKLESVLKMALGRAGHPVNQNQIENLVKIVRAYIENVPFLMENVADIANRKGIANQVFPMLNAVERYFLEPQDFIPDHLGLIGLLDDAYLAQKLVEVLSNNYRQQTGRPLINTDLSEWNTIVRNLIGEPIASMLDQAVMGTVQMPTMQQFFQNIMNFQGMMPMATPDPIYGNMSCAEIANVRLGAMGVV